MVNLRMRVCLTLIPMGLLLGMAGGGCSRPTGGAANNVVNVYSWSDYIAPDTVANFERETGIKVRYDTYDSNEVLETKLMTGHSEYDVVVPTGTFFEQQRRAGAYRPLEKSALTNLGNLDNDILRRMAVHDPGNQYGVPYMWTTTGLGYDREQIRKRLGDKIPDGWALLLDPSNAAKLKDCGVTIIESPIDVFQSVILYLGRDPNRFDPADVAAAAEVLMKIRPFVRYVDTALYMNDLANGSVCFSLGWSGDIVRARTRAREAGTGVDIVYMVPREGAVLTIDMMGVPVDAPHPKNAMAWLNYLMRPDVIAHITNFIAYPNGNSASLPLVDAALRNDTGVYPDAATRARLITPLAVPADYSRLVTREWTRFRTGN